MVCQAEEAGKDSSSQQEEELEMTDRKTFISQVAHNNPSLVIRIILIGLAEIVWLAYLFSSRLLSLKHK